MIKGKNFNLSPPADIQNGEIFEDCNLIQIAPHTAICSGITGLTFRRCNLTNCDVPEDAVIDDCGGVGRHKSRCSHLHPHFIKYGLEICESNCEHVIDTDKVRVDGELIDTIYHYKDKRAE